MGIPNIDVTREIDKTFTPQMSKGLILGVIGTSERGPVTEEQGAPATLKSDTDVDMVLGRETSTYRLARYLKYVIGKGAEVHYTRCVASGTAASKTLKDAGADDALTITATSPGAWGNSVLITITDNNADSGYFDLKIAYALQTGTPYNKTFYHLSMDPTRSDFVEYVVNGVHPLIEVEALGIVRPANASSQALASGVADDAPTATDYQSSMALFSSDKTITALTDDSQDGEVLSYGITYCETRAECLYWSAVPKGYTAANGILYRSGSGGYGYLDPDSSYGTLWFADILTKLSGSYGTVREWANWYVLGQVAENDSKAFPWFSPAGRKRGVIARALGVRPNVLDTADHASLVAAQINPVVHDKSLGKTMLWDNLTLSKNEGSMLQWLNVRRLLIWIKKRFAYHAATIMFEPNDPMSWKELHRLMNADLLYCMDNRGIQGNRDNPGYRYIGDQDALTIEQATYNTVDDIAAGKYRVALYVVPTPAIREIELVTTLSKTSASWTESE